MKWYLGIPVSLLLILACVYGSKVVGLDLTLIMVPGTALWAAIDSRKIELRKYKSGIAYGPVVLFIAVCLLWIIGFPWYLHVRYKVRNGLATLKREFREQNDGQISSGSALPDKLPSEDVGLGEK